MLMRPIGCEPPELASPSADNNQSISLIGAATSRGCTMPGCEQSPARLLQLNLTGSLELQGIHSHWQAIIQSDEKKSVVEATAELSQQLAAEVEKQLSLQQFFAVIGGDHSCAIGTWNGVSRARQGQPFGLIWVDAHMDSHTPHSSHSGALHGMPLACLLGFGPPSLVQLTASQAYSALQPEHLCLLGVRSYESEEAELLENLGVRVIAMEEIHQRGMSAAIEEAISITSRAGEIGLSFDLDALDPELAPGVSTPAADGINRSELNELLNGLAHSTNLIGVEIAEFNPLFDQEHRTARLISSLLAACTPTTQLEHGVSS